MKQLAAILQISIGSTQNLLSDVLNLSRICARLTDEQKANRVSICRYWQNQVRNDPTWLDNVITVDETWIYVYNPETKQQSTQWVPKGSPPPKKTRANKTTTKAMIITFFDKYGMLYTHAVPNKQKVNAEYYISALKQVIWSHIQRKRPTFTKGRWKLHQDNARPHVARSVMDLMMKLDIQVIPCPPYNPDLAPCDFFLYAMLKNQIKSQKFDSVEAALAAIQAILKRMSEEDFQHVYKNWQEWWEKCIRLEGEYTERDTSDVK